MNKIFFSFHILNNIKKGKRYLNVTKILAKVCSCNVFCTIYIIQDFVFSFFV